MNACMHTVAYSDINITTRMRMHAGMQVRSHEFTSWMLPSLDWQGFGLPVFKRGAAGLRGAVWDFLAGCFRDLVSKAPRVPNSQL